MNKGNSQKDKVDAQNKHVLLTTVDFATISFAWPKVRSLLHVVIQLLDDACVYVVQLGDVPDETVGRGKREKKGQVKGTEGQVARCTSDTKLPNDQMQRLKAFHLSSRKGVGLGCISGCWCGLCGIVTLASSEDILGVGRLCLKISLQLEMRLMRLM